MNNVSHLFHLAIHFHFFCNTFSKSQTTTSLYPNFSTTTPYPVLTSLNPMKQFSSCKTSINLKPTAYGSPTSLIHSLYFPSTHPNYKDFYCSTDKELKATSNSESNFFGSPTSLTDSSCPPSSWRSRESHRKRSDIF